MLKVTTVCGAGVGSSMMLRIFADQILQEEGIDAVVECSDIGSVDPNSTDIIITTSDFANILRNSSAKIVRIDNLMDKAYLKEQLLNAINEMNK